MSCLTGNPIISDYVLNTWFSAKPKTEVDYFENNLD